MGSIETSPIVAALPSARGFSRVESGEKSRGDNGLHSGGEYGGSHRRANDRYLPQRDMSHSETDSEPTPQNASRWSSPFVAQVLGQVLSQDGPDIRASLAAYERDDVRRTCRVAQHGWLLDSRI